MRVTIHQARPIVESLEKLLSSVTDKMVREKATAILYAEIREKDFTHAWRFCREFPFFDYLELPKEEQEKAADKFFQKHKTLNAVLNNVENSYSWSWHHYLRKAEIDLMCGERNDVLKLIRRLKTLHSATYASPDFCVDNTLELEDYDVRILMMALSVK